jgi:hypothetical protein
MGWIGMPPPEPRRAFGPAARPREPRRTPALGAVIGAVAAALASLGLAYWISGSEDRSLPFGTAPTPALRVYAPLEPDAGQVARAYGQLQEIYAEHGLAGVTAFSRACAAGVTSNPGMLDFCLAFDIYADSLEADDEAARAWQTHAGQRDLALTQSVLAPGQDAGARMAAVGLLARQASLAAPEVVAPPAPTQASAPPAAKPAVPSAAARKTAAARQTAAARARAVAACRKRGPPARRVVCPSPALRQADLRMRRAYQRAAASGVDSHRLASDQARWRAQVNAAAPNRAAVARLYARRTATLQAQAKR